MESASDYGLYKVVRKQLRDKDPRQGEVVYSIVDEHMSRAFEEAVIPRDVVLQEWSDGSETRYFKVKVRRFTRFETVSGSTKIGLLPEEHQADVRQLFVNTLPLGEEACEDIADELIQMVQERIEG